MRTAESFDAALTDPLLLGAAIDDIETWATWRTILKAAFGQPLTDPELDLLAILAGPSRAPPTSPVRELWVIAGRRSGKSRMAAAVASFVGSLDHRHRLAPGETGYIVIMSPTRDQSKAISGTDHMAALTKARLTSEPEPQGSDPLCSGDSDPFRAAYLNRIQEK